MAAIVSRPIKAPYGPAAQKVYDLLSAPGFRDMSQHDSDRIQVTVNRAFDVSPDRVFSAWLVPRMLGQWMFGARLRDENVVRLDLDPQVGGRFSLKVEREGMLLDHVGEYREIEHPSRLVFTWEISGQSDDEASVVSIDIVPSGGGCELTLTHSMDARWSGYEERTRDAWSTMLDALAGLPVAANPLRDR